MIYVSSNNEIGKQRKQTKVRIVHTVEVAKSCFFWTRFRFLVKVLCLKVAFDSFLKNAHTFQMEKTGKHRHCSNKLGKKHEKNKPVLVRSEQTKLLVQFTKVMSKESAKVTNESKNVTHS